MKAIITSFLIVIGISLGNVAPSFSQSHEQLLRKGMLKEEGEGNLNEAIVIYTKIAEDSSAERSLQAKALLQIGLCYEKMGGKQASKAYERIIEQYADQLKTAEIAKTRLQIINSQIPQQKNKKSYNPISSRIILKKMLEWHSYKAFYFDFSPDGKKVVYVGRAYNNDTHLKQGRTLYIFDVSGSPDIKLVENYEFGSENFPRYSPDGRQIAFVGTSKNEVTGIEGFYTAIYVVSADGGKPKQISEKVKNEYLTKSLAWHPDNRHISYAIREGMVTIDLSGKITDTTFINVDGDIWLAEYSPDGKWISAYALKDYYYNTSDVFLISTNGGKPVWVTENAGYDGYGTWSHKDDYSLYFVSSVHGDQNIFRINIDSDTGKKIGGPEQLTFFSGADVFAPKIIKNKPMLAYGLQQGNRLIIVPENENFENYKTIAYGYDAVLSPEGKTVYFISFTKNDQGIYSIPRSGGIKNNITADLPADSISCRYFSLSPDGSTIAFFNKYKENKNVLWFLSTENGKLFRSLTINSAERSKPDWSPDGKKLAFACDGGLYIVPTGADKAEKLAEIKYWEPTSIRWSPDGTYIAGLGKLDYEKSSAILIVSAQSGDCNRLTRKVEDKKIEGLEWHPDSKRLTFLYWKSNTIPRLREAYVDGSPTTPFFDVPDVFEYLGKWDPEGKSYYFRGGNGTDWFLYRYDSESKEISTVSDLPYSLLPSWSKDGKFMILQGQDIDTQLWMMDFEN